VFVLSLLGVASCDKESSIEQVCKKMCKADEQCSNTTNSTYDDGYDYSVYGYDYDYDDYDDYTQGDCVSECRDEINEDLSGELLECKSVCLAYVDCESGVLLEEDCDGEEADARCGGIETACWNCIGGTL